MLRYFNRLDSLAIGYVLITSSQPVRYLNISSRNNEDDDMVTVLLEQLCQADLSKLRTLKKKISPVINDKGFHNLTLVLKKASKVRFLIIHVKFSYIQVLPAVIMQNSSTNFM